MASSANKGLSFILHSNDIIEDVAFSQKTEQRWKTRVPAEGVGQWIANSQSRFWFVASLRDFFYCLAAIQGRYWGKSPTSLWKLCWKESKKLVNQNGVNSALPGAYAQAGYFLTGEHRPYDRKTGSIDGIIPKSNLTFAGTNRNPGLGAWEVAGRWSWLDLNDDAIQGGTIVDYTAGVNGYWNPYTKMVFNYVHSISDSPVLPQIQTDMFGVRAQLDF